MKKLSTTQALTLSSEIRQWIGIGIAGWSLFSMFRPKSKYSLYRKLFKDELL